ncbi:hypothetical protein BaRGS_00028601, partial [Batillaria attramentaria]
IYRLSEIKVQSSFCRLRRSFLADPENTISDCRVGCQLLTPRLAARAVCARANHQGANRNGARATARESREISRDLYPGSLSARAP